MNGLRRTGGDDGEYTGLVLFADLVAGPTVKLAVAVLGAGRVAGDTGKVAREDTSERDEFVGIV